MKILEKIKTRGYCRVLVHPTSFNERLFGQLADLEAAVEKNCVSLRGWDFPHIDRRQGMERGTDFVEQSTDWGQYKEGWRFYQSGQFAFYAGYRWDWGDDHAAQWAPSNWPPYPANKILPFEYTVCWVTEFVEFCARLASSLPSYMNPNIEIKFYDLNDRLLWSPHRIRFQRQAKISSYVLDGRDNKHLLMEEPRRLGRLYVADLFQRFHADISEPVLAQIQDEILRR